MTRYTGICLSGQMTVHSDDGTEAAIGAGDVFVWSRDTMPGLSAKNHASCSTRESRRTPNQRADRARLEEHADVVPGWCAVSVAADPIAARSPTPPPTWTLVNSLGKGAVRAGTPPRSGDRHRRAHDARRTGPAATARRQSRYSADFEHRGTRRYQLTDDREPWDLPCDDQATRRLGVGEQQQLLFRDR